MPDWEDYYEILGVDPEASAEEIRHAYRAKLMDYHPDRQRGATEAVQRLAAEKLKEVISAGVVLRDPEKRRQFHAEWLPRKGPPKLEVSPTYIRFNDSLPGQRQHSSFVVRNIGGPYTTIRVGNPDSWLRVTGVESMADDDELPLRVELEAQGQEADKTYMEGVTVHLDHATVTVGVELRTKHTAATAISFPDASLEAAIRAGLNKPGGRMAQADLLRVTSLRATHAGIRDLSGLENATNLTELDLEGNRISDISALSSLTNLTELDLENNQISDISALSSLTNLTKLDGKPISPAARRPGPARRQGPRRAATTASQQSTRPAGPAAISFPDASLEAAIRVGLKKPTGRITQADLVRLTSLRATDAGTRDLSGLENATNLTELYLWNNEISDISALSSLTNLTKLNLWDNQISDISALSSLTNLTELYLRNNKISDISALSSLTNLTELDLRHNKISDPSGLSALTNLTKIELDGNPISPAGIGFPDAILETAIRAGLNKPGGPITQADLVRLTSLRATAAGIRDLSGLENATNLTELNLRYNEISDISALSSLTNLTKLDLWGNQISDISALASLTNLTELNLWGNEIGCVSVIWWKTKVFLRRMF